jgi:small subunit ribosomal protein S3
MGRKVHPIGYRLGVIKDWGARWYAPKGKYADQLQQDFTIRRLVAREMPRSGIARVDIDRFPSQLVVTIWTAKPGIVIGRKGAQVKVLRQKLEELTGTRVKVEVEEISNPDLEAQLVAMRQGAQGVRIAVSGRLGGSEMSRRDWQREGRVPLQTLRADIDFAKAEALTTFGRIGVKVWIYKGEKMPEAEEVSEATDVYVSE